MKLLIYTILLSLSITATAQKNLPDYKASNGVTYHVGDTLKLGRGDGHNGEFKYVVEGGLAASDGADGLPRSYSGRNGVIKKVWDWKKKGASQYILVIGVGLMTNYYVYIEDAIATCEVSPCKDAAPTVSTDDKFDKLKKLKELLDSGAITQEEYDAEKKKILE